jgi:beta-galactosidase
MLMVEAFDMWETPKTRFDYARFFEDRSTSDIGEMVLAARNSPAVILWSIGNEIRGMSLATAERLAETVRAVDATRPVVMGSDGYRSLPEPGSTNGGILSALDGLGVNYNTAMSVDALHAAYPDTFMFESESSPSTSTRGVFQDPGQLNTGENYTPGKRAVSSYDNNVAPWTMPGEYGLKKDRDRPFFTGEFLWSGFDYIGEPTPYFGQFPVKSSFFGAVDTAGFAKDLYWLFRSEWTLEPTVHLLPMDWTDHDPGEPVEVWAYANVDTVELFLNGESLGVRRFDRKETLNGAEYLETTEATGDDKTFETGSYTSPNGSSGKLHLSWTVPFEPGELVAVAKRDGVIADDNGWSNFYRKAATPLLPAVSRAHARDWVALSWNEPVVVDRLVVHFATTDTATPPAETIVRYWNGTVFTTLADADTSPGRDGEPTVIEFEPVATNALRLEMKSAAPGTGDGFIRISELEAFGDPVPRAEAYGL